MLWARPCIVWRIFNDINIYIHYPISPAFYWVKKEFINKVFKKKVLCVELQAEPWCPDTLYNSTVAEQQKTMSIGQLKGNIDFCAKKPVLILFIFGAGSGGIG